MPRRNEQYLCLKKQNVSRNLQDRLLLRFHCLELSCKGTLAEREAGKRSFLTWYVAASHKFSKGELRGK